MAEQTIRLDKNPAYFWGVQVFLIALLCIIAASAALVWQIHAWLYDPNAFRKWFWPATGWIALMLISFVRMFEGAFLQYHTVFTVQGIEQRGLFLRKQIRWDDITGTRLLPGQVTELQTAGMSVRINLRHFVDRGAVAAIIAHHIPEAAATDFEKRQRALWELSGSANVSRRSRLRRMRRTGIGMIAVSAVTAAALSSFRVGSALFADGAAAGFFVGVMLLMMGWRR